MQRRSSPGRGRRSVVQALVLVGLLSVVAACGSAAPAARAPSTTAPGGVAARTLATRDLSVGGVPRTYSMMVPDAAPPVGIPLIVMVHLFVTPPDSTAPGAVGSGDGSPLVRAGLRDGFAVAIPTGTDFSFNGGTCCGAAVRNQVDDVALIDAVIDDAVARDGIDPSRVYVVGFSNGGFLAYRYACERAERVAGVAVVEGALLTPCAPARPVDLLVLQQRRDPIVPATGTASSVIPGDPVPLPATAASFAEYTRAARCAAPRTRTSAKGVRTTTARCGGRTARLVMIPGGAHRFPTAAAGFDGAGTIVDTFDLGGTGR